MNDLDDLLRIRIVKERLASQGEYRPIVSGCIRKNLYQLEPPQEEVKDRYRWVRAAIILRATGADAIEVPTPWGKEVFFVLRLPPKDELALVVFRAGEEQERWKEEIFREYLVARAYLREPVDLVILLWENRGDLAIQPIAYRELDERVLDEKMLGVLRDIRGKRRIRKDSAEAGKWCRVCPFLRNCSALDMERGETADWASWMKDAVWV